MDGLYDYISPASEEDYTLAVEWSEKDGAFRCTCKEIPYIATVGATEAAAKAEILELIPFFLMDWGPAEKAPPIE
jgi:predicted RNase H-like HicB family nuclease